MGNARICTLSLVVALCCCASASEAQHKGATGVITTRFATRRGAGRDENIRQDEAVNSRTAPARPAPAAKGGQRTRGAAVGRLRVDNRSDAYIRVYVDGDYVGTVGPYGDLDVYLGCEDHALYAVARFSDGDERVWGPVVANTCADIVWRLPS